MVFWFFALIKAKLTLLHPTLIQDQSNLELWQKMIFKSNVLKQLQKLVHKTLKGIISIFYEIQNAILSRALCSYYGERIFLKMTLIFSKTIPRPVLLVELSRLQTIFDAEQKNSHTALKWQGQTELWGLLLRLSATKELEQDEHNTWN